MSEQENEALIRRLYDILNEGDLGAADELLSADYVWHGPGGQEVTGPEGFKDLIGGFRSAFPDLRFTIEQLFASGDEVVCRFTTRGTHRGEFEGIAPTGKQIATSGIIISRFEQGRVVEEWEELNMLGLMQQIGAIPAPAEA